MTTADISSMAESGFDAALGAFLGACVGDAAGAVLEFSPDANAGIVSAERVRAIH